MRSPLALVRAARMREYPAIVAAALVAVGVEIGLRVTTLPRVAAVAGLQLDVGADTTPTAVADERVRLRPRAWRQLRATRRVMRHWPFGDTCLRRALVSGQRLRRFRPVLHVGVAKIDGELRSHAWLTIGGASLDPEGTATFATFTPVNRTGQP